MILRHLPSEFLRQSRDSVSAPYKIARGLGHARRTTTIMCTSSRHKTLRFMRTVKRMRAEHFLPLSSNFRFQNFWHWETFRTFHVVFLVTARHFCDRPHCNSTRLLALKNWVRTHLTVNCKAVTGYQLERYPSSHADASAGYATTGLQAFLLLAQLEAISSCYFSEYYSTVWDEYVGLGTQSEPNKHKR